MNEPISHIKFSPKTKVALIGIGAGLGAVVGMTKANSIEDTVNKLIDTANVVLIDAARGVKDQIIE